MASNKRVLYVYDLGYFRDILIGMWQQRYFDMTVSDFDDVLASPTMNS